MQNVTQANPFQIKTLADKMMTVRTKITRQRRTVSDKRAASHVASVTGTQSDDWVVSKRLFKASNRYKEMQTAINAVTAYIKDHTSPWTDDGFRGLPNANYMTFTQGLNPLIVDAELAVSEFTGNWSNEVAADIARLGSSADAADYPVDPPSIDIVVTFRPVASTGDFRVEVSDHDRKRLEDELRRTEDGVRDDIVQRMTSKLGQISTRLGEYTGEKGQRWHQDMVDHALDMCATLESLNINDDADIQALLSSARQALAPFVGNGALKVSQLARDKAKANVDSILDKFS